MPRILTASVRNILNRATLANTVQEKGRAYEDLICEVFSHVPGIEIAERNALNAFQTEEVDVALWNNRSLKGLHFLPHIIPVECKNWSNPVGTEEVSYFADKLRHRGCDHGFLITANGITGNPQSLTAAHFRIATALAEGIRVIVITTPEIEALTSAKALVTLVKKKLCQLTASGTIYV